MPTYKASRTELAEFKSLLEQALQEVRLPSGIIDQDHIIPNSIGPDQCNLRSTWNFNSNLQAGSINIRSLKRRVTKIESSLGNNDSSQAASIKTNDVAEINRSASVGNEDIYFLDATKTKLILSLPAASKSVGRKLYIKRIDANKNQICRVLPFGADKVDDTDGVELNAKQAVILIASTKQWHVFSSI